MLGTLSINLYLSIQAFVIRGLYQIDVKTLLAYVDPLALFYHVNASGNVVTVGITSKLISYITFVGVDAYFVISGICCCFSRNNLKRAVRLLAGGVLIALVTKGYAILLNDPAQYNRFGALMCYAACQLITLYFFENRSEKVLAAVALIAFFIGYFLRYYGVPATRLPIFYIFGVQQIGDQSGDYWPIFPMLGWFLTGVLIGRKKYAGKQSVRPDERIMKATAPLRWLGRNSGVVYVLSKLSYTAILIAAGNIFGLL